MGMTLLIMAGVGGYSFWFGLGLFKESREGASWVEVSDSWALYWTGQVIALVIGTLLLTCLIGVFCRWVYQLSKTGPPRDSA